MWNVRSPNVWPLVGLPGGGYRFETDCIGSDSASIRDMVDQERSITLRTFREAIGLQAWKELQATLGYDRFTPISRDWAVSFHKSVYRGLPAVYVRWSHIEYIFVKR